MATLSKLDKLTYSIGIIDKVTGPVNKVMAKINQLSQQTAAAQDQMMRGAATAVGGGYALAKSLAPAIDHVAALGEVQSLGVADDALQQLTKTSYKFGFEFGGNSAEFVRSAYDIQSAIAGLSGFELSEFTKSSNILAVATKADAGTITSYMGTMYGIFEKTANKMGKSNWVNQIAGQTATAVQLYKTTGAEMQAAFSNLSNTATSVGLSSAQQFAMVGQLQLVAKSGSVAGTQAEKFIQGIGKAEKVLGLKLTTDNGDMLAVDAVLEKINGKISSLGSVDKLGVLTEIFGAQGAKAVNVLSEKVQGLNADITKFENVQDSSKAIEMAKIIASPWDRLGGSFNAAATAMGSRLLPVVEPFVELLAVGFAGIVSLTERFPILSSVIATLVVGIVALISIYGVVMFTMGLYKMALVTSGALTMGLTVITKLWQGALIALRVLGFLSLIATVGAAAIAFGAFKGVMLAGQAATWLFNTALLANPITWIVLGVMALIAAVAALIYYWDDLVAAFSQTTWGKALMGVFDVVKAAFNGVIDSVKWVLEALGLIDETEAKIKTDVVTTSDNISKATSPLPTNVPAANDAAYFTNQHKTQPAQLTEREASINAFKFTSQQLPPVPTDINARANPQALARSQALINSAFPVTAANDNAEKANQISVEQQATAYKPKVQKSAYLQSLTNNNSNTQNSNRDHSKRVYIDNLTVKSDDPINSIEQLMELAG